LVSIEFKEFARSQNKNATEQNRNIKIHKTIYNETIVIYDIYKEIMIANRLLYL